MIKHIPIKINGRIFVKVVVGNMGYTLIPYYEALEIEKELQRKWSNE